MDERRNITGYSFSWTQPLNNYSFNPFYQDVRAAELELELDRLDAVDLIVDQMDEFPEALEIIKRIWRKTDDA